MRTPHRGTWILLAIALLPTIGLDAQSPTLTRSSVPVLGSANIVVGNRARMDALVDGNLDGKMDAVGFFTSARDRTRGEVRFMANDGKGQMSERVMMANIYIVANSPKYELVIGDWDGDGNDDFALNLFNGQFSYFYSRTGGPIFYTTARFTPVGAITDAVAADFNGDKRDDMAILTTAGSYLFLNSGTLPAVLGNVRAGGGTQLRVIDLDKDGAPDLMYTVSNSALQMLKIHRKSPWTGPRSDAVTNHKLFQVGTTYGFHPTAGDIDKDGDDDAVLFDGRTGRYQVLRQTTAGKFTQESWLTGGPATGLADVDGDGDLDGVCCGGGGGGGGPTPGLPNTIAVAFEVAINDNGKFRPSIKARNIGARHIAGVADMNGDGKVELVAGRGILFNRHGFGSNVGNWLAAPNRAWLRPQTALDFDGDGDVDVHTQFYSEVYRNRGDGKLALKALQLPNPPSGYSWSTAVHYRGDWDGDGDQDLILCAFTGVTSIKGMHLVRNEDGIVHVDAGAMTPAGDSFYPHATYRKWAVPAKYFAIDINKDGLVDLVTYARSNVPSRAFLNQGNRKFTEITHGIYGELDDMRDLDGDGYPEIITNRLGGIQIYKGTKSGSPGTKTEFIRGSYPSAYGLTDHDGDGDLDIYALRSKAVVVMINNGSGGFTTHSLITGLRSGTKLWVRDLDGDGRDDMLVVPGTQIGTAFVVTSPATNRFEWREQALMDDFVHLVDMDGDGDLDLVGNHLMRNITEHGAGAGAMVQFGVSTNGTRGIVPQLGASGPFRPGHVSGLHLRHCVTNTLAMVIAGVGDANMLNFPWIKVNTYVWPQPFQAIVPVGAKGTWDLRVKLGPGIANSTLYYQAYALDSTAPMGIVSTNGVRVRYGN